MLHHVALEISDIDRDRFALLLETVGFERVIAPGTVSETISWFESGGSQIHLFATDRPAVPTLGHAAVVVGDLERAVTALRAEDFEVTEATKHWDERRVFVAAPGGHRIELMAAPPS